MIHPIPALSDAERAALDDLRVFLRERFGERVRDLALFGSTARGERHEESDVDVLVVVDALTSLERREIGCYSGDLLTKYDVLIAPFAVSKDHLEHLERRERLIAREIARDRIPL